jgi:hypothetical protein
LNHVGHDEHDETIGRDNLTKATYPCSMALMRLCPAKQAVVSFVPVVVQLLWSIGRSDGPTAPSYGRFKK